MEDVTDGFVAALILFQTRDKIEFMQNDLFAGSRIWHMVENSEFLPHVLDHSRVSEKNE